MNDDRLAIVVTIYPQQLLIDLLIVAAIAAPFVYWSYRSSFRSSSPRKTNRLISDRRLGLPKGNMFRYFREGPD